MIRLIDLEYNNLTNYQSLSGGVTTYDVEGIKNIAEVFYNFIRA